MCRIELFDVVFPNGAREQREQLVNCCARGTPRRPCRNVEYVNTYQERPASVAELRAAAATAATPRTETITPRGSERSASRPGSREKDKGVLGDIATVFKKWKRSSWGKSGKATGAKMAFVRPVSRERGPRPPVIDYPLPANPPPRAPSPPRRQTMHPTPQVIPIRPSRDQDREQERGRRREPERRTRRRRSPRPTVIHQSSSEEETPSPPTAAREHRRSRSLSPNSKYEMEKAQMLRERARRQYAERVKQEQQAAQQRAERLAEFQRLEAVRLRQERLEFEERKRIESAERARRRRDREEWESEQARRRQELADRQRLAAARERRLQEREEQDRLDRARRANVPRRPHHAVAVHQTYDMEDRAERYIRDAIREANLRHFERRSPPSAGRRDDIYGGGLRRNNTTGGTHRRGHAGDQPWNSR